MRMNNSHFYICFSNKLTFTWGDILRKYLKKILFLVLTIILLGIVLFILKKEHKVTYSLKKDDYNFQIEENFHNKTLYDFFITTNKKSFAFTLNKNYFKQRKIIKNIDVYHKKDLLCIYPILKNDYKEDYHCLYKNKPVSISYLSTLNDDYIQKFLKTRALKLKIPYPKKSSKKSFSKIEVYQDNILPNYKFLIWNYKGIYLLSPEENKNIKLLTKDKYENTLAAILNNFYIYIDTTKKKYSTINYFDIEKEKNYIFKIKDYELSKRIYFNGIYNNELYITDLDTKKEYKFNPKKKKFTQVNELDKYLIVKNNKLTSISKAKFLEKKYYFNESTKNNKITKIFKTKEIVNYQNYYYFKVDNKIYKALKGHEETAILLFELDNIKEWKILEDTLLIINNDTLYFYNDKIGLVPIVKSKELKYNYKNICNFWKK